MHATASIAHYPGCVFSLLEDECRKLNIEMALTVTLSSGDTERYKNYTALVQKDRKLLDEQHKLEDQVTLLEQTLSLLLLSPGSNNLPTHAVVAAIAERRAKITEVVSVTLLIINAL